MEKSINRRDFFKAGFGCCALLMASRLPGADLISKFDDPQKPIDPKTLCYCGYTCPEDCKFLNGTLNNDEEMKKEAYKTWKLKERFGVEYDSDKMICYGCKAEGKPEGFVVSQCTVRPCAMEKGYDACIQCKELATCDNELWTRFPKFHEHVIGMRKQYLARQSGK